DAARRTPDAARGTRLPRQPVARRRARPQRPAASGAAPVSEAAPARPARPGFGYARRHGVALTGWRDGGADIACRAGVSADVLAELRRHLGAPLQLATLDDAAFERLLRDLYEQGDDARAMVSDLDERMDLKTLAD